MTSELSDLIWGRLGLAAVRAVPLEEPRAPSAEAARGRLDRELRLRPLPGQHLHHRRHAGSKTCWRFGCPSSRRSASRSC